MRIFRYFAVIVAVALCGAAVPAGAGERLVGFMMKNNVDINERRTNEGVRGQLRKQQAAGKIDRFVEVDAETDVQKQLNQIEDLFNMGVTVVIMAPAEAAGCAPILDRCREENIPIVVVCSKTTNTDELATAFVGSNDFQGGQMLARYAIDKLPNGGGIFHLQGALGNSATIDRTSGIHDVLDPLSDKYPIRAELTGEWSRERSIKIMEDWLQMYDVKDINAVLCDNDDMAIAASLAAQAADCDKQIYTIGFDAIDDALALVKQGVLDATIKQDVAAQGDKAAEFAAMLANGESVPRSHLIPFTLITGDNVDEFYKK